MKEPKESTIGGVARAAGVNVETVRYYQRTGLVPVPERAHGSFRDYPPEIATRVRFIKRAQQLGFTLAEVKNLLALEDGRSCGKAQSLAATKLAAIDARIADLNRMRRTLKNLIGQCGAGGGKIRCPIIETLAHGST
ncbi:MAG TPA: MerR family DNA-binding protein [Burkholderiales bacterium]|jgi:MerR family mercuric resistance operon transcriptional regulator|nr:MerR family DNA-binding protein [Burkholderiales bacterium]